MSVDADIPVFLSFLFVIGGLLALAKSADVFVDSASALARRFGISPLIVGMVIIGFGTSAPELLVSLVAGICGHSNISLGNAYGSATFNIGVILGVTSIIWPVRVKSSVSFVAVPILLLVAILSWFLLRDGEFGRCGGLCLLLAFAVIMPLYCWYDQRSGMGRFDSCGSGTASERRSIWRELSLLVAGLSALVLSSHLMVWGCVDFARDVLHVSDLMIGLTVVAAGTSLPELASAIASAKRGESELVVGNIVGSNLFNALVVVGLAGTLSPFDGFSGRVVGRDIPVMVAMTLSIAVFGINYRHPRNSGVISRIKGVTWVFAFIAYMALMLMQEAA